MDTHLSQCQEFIRQCSLLQREFWQELVSEVPDLQTLNQLGSKMNTTIKNAKDHWNKLNKYNVTLPRVLRLYGEFSQVILNDKAAAKQLFKKAQSYHLQQMEGEDQDERQIMEGMLQPISIIQVGSCKNELGFVKKCNEHFVSMFGWVKEEMIDKPITSIMPEIYSQYHPCIVKAWTDSPEREASGYFSKDNHVFGKHSTNYIFPIVSRVKILPVESDEPSSLTLFGYIRTEPFIKNYTFLICTKDGVLMDLSSSAISNIGLDYSMIKKQKINIKDLLKDRMALIKNEYQRKGGKQITYIGNPSLGLPTKELPMKVFIKPILLNNQKIKEKLNDANLDMGEVVVGYIVRLEVLARQQNIHMAHSALSGVAPLTDVASSIPQQTSSTLETNQFHVYGPKFQEDVDRLIHKRFIRDILGDNGKELKTMKSYKLMKFGIRNLMGEDMVRKKSRGSQGKISRAQSNSPKNGDGDGDDESGSDEINPSEEDSEAERKNGGYTLLRLKSGRIVNPAKDKVVSFQKKLVDSDEEFDVEKSVFRDRLKYLEMMKEEDHTVKSQKVVEKALNSEREIISVKIFKYIAFLWISSMLGCNILNLVFIINHFSDISDSVNTITLLGMETVILSSLHSTLLDLNYQKNGLFKASNVDQTKEEISDLITEINQISEDVEKNYPFLFKLHEDKRYSFYYIANGQLVTEETDLSYHTQLMLFLGELHLTLPDFTQSSIVTAPDSFFALYRHNFIDELLPNSKMYFEDVATLDLRSHTFSFQSHYIPVLLILIILLSSVVFMVIFLKVIRKIQEQKEEILLLFLDIPAKEVEVINQRCEEFVNFCNNFIESKESNEKQDDEDYSLDESSEDSGRFKAKKKDVQVIQEKDDTDEMTSTLIAFSSHNRQ